MTTPDMDPQPRADHPAVSPVRHETSDANVGVLLGFGVGMIVAGVMIHFTVWLLFTYFSAREARRVAPEFPMAVGQATRLPPEPRLQAHPREDLRELRVQEDLILNSYGWVDRGAGIVRIPIDKAMDLTVERGLPARSPTGQGR